MVCEESPCPELNCADHEIEGLTSPSNSSIISLITSFLVQKIFSHSVFPVVKFVFDFHLNLLILFSLYLNGTI